MQTEFNDDSVWPPKQQSSLHWVSAIPAWPPRQYFHMHMNDTTKKTQNTLVNEGLLLYVEPHSLSLHF